MNKIQRRGDIDKCPVCGSHCDPAEGHRHPGVLRARNDLWMGLGGSDQASLAGLTKTTTYSE